MNKDWYPETLKKKEILRGYRNFQLVFQQGKKISGKYIHIFFIENSKRVVGFCLSKKYRRAVDRNRMRRMMKEIYRKNKQAFPKGKLVLFGKYTHPLPSIHNLLIDLEKLLDHKLRI